MEIVLFQTSPCPATGGQYGGGGGGTLVTQ